MRNTHACHKDTEDKTVSCICVWCLHHLVALMWRVVFGFAVRIIDVRKPLQLLLELLMCARSTQVRKQTAAR